MEKISNNKKNCDLWYQCHSQDDYTSNKKNKDITDLEIFIRKIRKSISKFRSNKNIKLDNSFKKEPFYMSNHIFGILIIIIFVWIISGFYTIKEAEKGVVTRFGKFSHLVDPGLNWKPNFIDDVIPINVESVKELAASGIMLTSDENVVHVEMNVQYRITDPKCYLFNVVNADDSLRQATDSALRGVIGKYNMDRILTEGRTVIRNDTQRELEETIRPYNMGISLLDVNFQTARPPEEVKAAFDDAIAARENEQQYIREAEAYVNEVKPRANGKAQRILEEGRAYRTRTILEAQGEIARFIKILPEYKFAPEITRQRLYIETMEKVLSHASKVLVNENKDNHIFVLPLEQIVKNTKNIPQKNNSKSADTALPFSTVPDFAFNKNKKVKEHHGKEKNILDKRRANAKRNEYLQEE